MFVRYSYGTIVDQEIMNHTLGAPGHEPIVEAGHSSSFCDHHPPALQPGTDTSSNENHYPPLPPLRIGATTVSCVVCDTFNENIRRASLAIDGEQPRTPLLPTSHPDWNVRKWQTRQIAKAFMDNTINSVLDEMGFTPVPESAPDSDPDDVLGSINFPRVDDDSDEEEEEDESVENEGILSAIQKHGLQRHTLQSLSEVSNRFRYASSPPTRHSPSPTRRWGPSQQHIYKPLHHSEESPSSTASLSVGLNSEVVTDEEILSTKKIRADGTDLSNDSNSDDEESHYFKNYVSLSKCRCPHVPSSNDTAVAHSSKAIPQCADSNSCLKTFGSCGDAKCIDEKTSKALVPSSHQECPERPMDQEEEEACRRKPRREIIPSNICKRRCVEPSDEDSKSSSSSSLHLSTPPDFDAGVMSITSHSSNRNSPTFGHFEFMDAAVAAAIQKKGLSALACQDL